MIVFTVTNQVSGQVYVGYTQNKLEEQWKKIIRAVGQGLDYPLYHEIREQGIKKFSVEEYYQAETRSEAKELEKEIIHIYGALSLMGYKTSHLIIKKKSSQRAKKNPDKLLSSFFDPRRDDFEKRHDFTMESMSEEEITVDKRPKLPTVITKNITKNQQQENTVNILSSEPVNAHDMKPVCTEPADSEKTTVAAIYQKRIAEAISYQRKKTAMRSQEELMIQKKELKKNLEQIQKKSMLLVQGVDRDCESG